MSITDDTDVMADTRSVRKSFGPPELLGASTSPCAPASCPAARAHPGLPLQGPVTTGLSAQAEHPERDDHA